MWLAAVGATFFISGFTSLFGWNQVSAAINLVMGMIMVFSAAFVFRMVPPMSKEEIDRISKQLEDLEEKKKEEV